MIHVHVHALISDYLFFSVTYICIAIGKFASEVVVSVTEIQTNQVTLMIKKPGEPNQPLNLPCRLCYVQIVTKEQKCVDQTDFQGHTNITILHLQPDTHYNVFVECVDVLSSNKLQFKTGNDYMYVYCATHLKRQNHTC